MAKIRLTSEITAPQGAHCSHCGAPAVVQCRCCEQVMCLQHAVFFVTPGRSEKAAVALDSVKCQPCDEQGEPEDEASREGLPTSGLRRLTERVASGEMASSPLLAERIAEALWHLPERERRVLHLRFGLDDGIPRTLTAIGQEFHVTGSRIRQIEVKALRKLRQYLTRPRV